jgi:hypothetical protein
MTEEAKNNEKKSEKGHDKKGNEVAKIRTTGKKKTKENRTATKRETYWRR